LAGSFTNGRSKLSLFIDSAGGADVTGIGGNAGEIFMLEH